MQIFQEAMPLLVGGGASLGGAYLAIKVHIGYLLRDSERQEKRLNKLEAAQVITDRKTDAAHIRIDTLQGIQQ